VTTAQDAARYRTELDEQLDELEWIVGRWEVAVLEAVYAPRDPIDIDFLAPPPDQVTSLEQAFREMVVELETAIRCDELYGASCRPTVPEMHG
jgi:hypothetical protein